MLIPFVILTLHQAWWYNSHMIALFDSGLGGLSVFQAVRQLLPNHDYLYLADSLYVPYGPRPTAWVRQRSLSLGQGLQQHGAKLLVVACNTASSAALEQLRATLPIPVVGLEPAIKPAVASTRSGKVGVLATAGTLNGARFASLVERYAGDVEVYTQPCHGWAEAVEQGQVEAPSTRRLVDQYVQPLMSQGVDTLVLGCTHYPFLQQIIQQSAGPGVKLIETGSAVARRVAYLVEQHQISAGTGHFQLYTTGNPATVSSIVEHLLGQRSTVAAWHEP